jgi:hypothetical protein
MKYVSYNRELKIATTQIQDVFNDIEITRLNQGDNESKVIRIPLVYGNRSRILKSLENKNGILKLPLMAMTISNLSRDKSRVSDQNQELIMRNGTKNLDACTAVPMNITYTLDIFTKYQEDMDQIISNIIPFMNPDLYTVWPNPKDPSKEAMMKSQVVWDDNVSLKYEDDESSTPWRINGTMSFVYKTWFFPGTDKYDFSKGIILKINPKDTLSSSTYDETGVSNLDYMSMFYDVPTTSSIEYFMTSSVPNGDIKFPRYDVMIQYPHSAIYTSTYLPSGNFIGTFDETNSYHFEQLSSNFS